MAETRSSRQRMPPTVTRRRSSRSTTCKMHFPIQQGFLRRTRRARQGGGRRQLHRRARRNPGPGRRERLRQDHDRPLHPARLRADRRQIRYRRARRAGRRSGHALDRQGDCARIRREIRMIFQDPYSSLNPRMTVLRHRRRAAAAPTASRAATSSKTAWRRCCGGRPAARVHAPLPARLLAAASASASASRARSRSTRSLIVCDEAVSALDVSVQAQILNLLADLQRPS